MPIIESNFSFIPECKKIFRSPHKLTRGTSVGRHVVKGSKFIMLNVQDYLNPVKSTKTQSEFRFSENEYASRFLKAGQALSNADVIGFVGYLEKKYPKTAKSIKFFNASIASSFKYISGLDPFFVVAGIKAQLDLNEDWMMLENDPKCLKNQNDVRVEAEHLSEEEKTNQRLSDLDLDKCEDWNVVITKKQKKQTKFSVVPEFSENDKRQMVSTETMNRYEERYLVYPFVYPAGIVRFAHVVLIIIDQVKKRIYYYDPQGLTSNDPARTGLFVDNPYFNLHKNLLKLANVLFKKEHIFKNKAHEKEEDVPQGEVLEFVSCPPHQNDPVSCGVFVCRALERLYQGKSPKEALYFDSSNEIITDTRKRMGLAYMQAMQEQTASTCIKEIQDKYFDAESVEAAVEHLDN